MLEVSIMSDLAQVLMDELDGDGSFANTRGDPFYGSVAHIADGENAGDAGFEQSGVSIERPALGPFSVFHQIGAGEDEAVARRAPLRRRARLFSVELR